MEARGAPEACRFGDFVFDARAFRVTREGVPIHLEPKAIDVLRYLLERPGVLVSKHELIHAVWQDTSVGDNALTRLIAQLRRALEDPVDRPRYIETIPTRGYRFVAALLPLDHGSIQETTTPPTAATTPRRPAVSRVGLVAGAIVLIAGIAVIVTMVRRVGALGAVRTDAATSGVHVRSVAVLPLENLSGDPGQEHVADGFTQAISDALSQRGPLTVASITSSSRYRGSTLPSSAIALALSVDALLEGAVIRTGSRVRVSIAMVNGASGQRVWARTFDRTTDDVLAIYDEVASAVVDETERRVDGSIAPGPALSGRVDAQTYDEYLRGMFFLGNRWMAGGCRNAERSLLRAIDRDPGFAPAHAALAWCYAYPDRLGRSIEEVGPKARAAVERALALDDRLALAHAVSGTIRWRIDYDAAGGGLELQRALELDSNSALVLLPAAEFFLWRGNPERALPLPDRALALDPFSPDRNVQVGYALLAAGRHHAAVGKFLRALELDPHYSAARFWLAESYGYLGEREAAVAEYLDWLDGALRPERGPPARARLQRAYVSGGWDAFWRDELSLAEEEVAQPGAVWMDPYTRFAGPWFMARRYARQGQSARALDALDHAYAERHHLMATLTLDPLFEPLRGTPRFEALRRRTGAPD